MARLCDCWELRPPLSDVDEERPDSLNTLCTETEEYMVGWVKEMDQYVVQK